MLTVQGPGVSSVTDDRAFATPSPPHADVRRDDADHVVERDAFPRRASPARP